MNIATQLGSEEKMQKSILTKREKEVFKLLVKNKVTKEIAEELKISEKTVRNHISNVMQKLGVKGRAAAVVELLKLGEIVVPEEYMGDVIGDVNSRRGRMEGMEANDGMQEIRAFIPLSEMFGYATDLRSKTQGRGNYSMEPSHYEEVPKSVLETIVASRAKKEE